MPPSGLPLDWLKAVFLFPLLGIPSHLGLASPEPDLAVIRRYAGLRRKFSPYLYNLFVRQEEHGDPILRPLCYEFDGSSLDEIADQFMVGPSILQAPFLDEASRRKAVTLPGPEPWLDASTADWHEPGVVTMRRGRETTPLFMRAGAIIPMRPGTPDDRPNNSRAVEFHIALPPAWFGQSALEYKADDGASYAYRRVGRSALRVKLACAEGNLAIAAEQTESGFGPLEPTFIIHGAPHSVRLNGADVALSKCKITLTGKPLPGWAVTGG